MITDSRFSISESARAEARIDQFDCVLQSGALTAVPVVQFGDTEAARASLEPYLVGWSAKAEVVDGLPIQFRFSSAVVEEDDVKGTSRRKMLASDTVRLSTDELARVQRSEYPAPDPGWREESALAADLRRRWREYRTGFGVLSAVAYRMITAVEHEYGRKTAPERLPISGSVFDEIRKLAGVDIERKIAQSSRALTDGERVWLVNAMTQLVRRIHEIEAGIPGLPVLNKKEI